MTDTPMTHDWHVTEQRVADVAMHAHFSYGDWPAVARAVIELLGDNDAHLRITTMRQTIKDLAIELDRAERDNVRLIMEANRLRQELREGATR